MKRFGEDGMKQIVESMKRVLLRRIVENLNEVDVYDNKGNIIIAKDLKVRHIDSQFEYTVANVVEDEQGVQIILRAPDKARFTPIEYTADVNIEGIGDLIITQDEFEKEYEVN